MTLTKTFGVKDVAEYFDVHVNTVRNWIKKGDLPAVKVGKSYRIQEEELKQFIEERKTTKQKNE